jgi:peptide/nickel transport system permease protein
MTAYLIRRLIQALIVVILTTAIVFFLMRLLPGDPIYMYMSQEQTTRITPEQLQAARHEFGLDKPMIVQYGDWIWNLFHGDLGRSIITQQAVTKTIGAALPISIYIGGIAFIISNLIGIPVGIICAVRRGKWIDTVLTVLANIGITAPSFWVGIILIYVFGLWLGWLPTHGFTPPYQDFWLSTRQLIMPLLCLMVFPISGTVRQTRSAMLEVTHQDYIRTAWAKGLSEKAIIYKHAIKNGLLPVVTLSGMGIAMIFGGQVLIETIYAIPGMGKLSVDALFNRDYAVVQGIVLLIAVVIVLANLLVDISYGWLDPRVSHE